MHSLLRWPFCLEPDRPATRLPFSRGRRFLASGFRHTKLIATPRPAAVGNCEQCAIAQLDPNDVGLPVVPAWRPLRDAQGVSEGDRFCNRWDGGIFGLAETAFVKVVDGHNERPLGIYLYRCSESGAKK